MLVCRAAAEAFGALLLAKAVSVSGLVARPAPLAAVDDLAAVLTGPCDRGRGSLNGRVVSVAGRAPRRVLPVRSVGGAGSPAASASSSAAFSACGAISPAQVSVVVASLASSQLDHLAWQLDAFTDAYPAVLARSYTRRVMMCPQCGHENPETNKFCGECAAPLGARLESAREVRKTVTVVFCDVTGSTALGE